MGAINNEIIKEISENMNVVKKNCGINSFSLKYGTRRTVKNKASMMNTLKIDNFFMPLF